MRVAADWQDYECIDATHGERLERWGDVLLIRPDPQVIWSTGRQSPLWSRAHARYHRSSSGGGRWEQLKKTPEVWSIGYKGLTFRLKPMGFKHTGLFPEQAVNWDFCTGLLRQRPGARVLNLFAYTGGATLACAGAGAQVTHVDASKGMVQWARDNAAASGLSGAPVRWLVDDCMKFVAREIRRGSRYQGIIMDPPSYGRGPSGEVWRLAEKIFALLEECKKILAKDALFFMVNTYTTGLSPAVMEYMLSSMMTPGLGGRVSSGEIGLPVSQTGLVLPCGGTAIWQAALPGRGGNP